jgi:hypothetical protein
MGRRRNSNLDDPPRFHKKGNVWYHVSGTLPRTWTKLSSDRAEALRLWAQRNGVREDESTRVFSVIAKRYVREVFPTKRALRSRLDKARRRSGVSFQFRDIRAKAATDTDGQVIRNIR